MYFPQGRKEFAWLFLLDEYAAFGITSQSREPLYVHLLLLFIIFWSRNVEIYST